MQAQTQDQIILFGACGPWLAARARSGVTIVFAAPHVDTTISLPSRDVGALGALAWPKTTTPHTDARHTEKHVVQEAVLPVHYMIALITPSLIPTGLLRDAAACPQEGGGFVLDWRHAGASASRAGRMWSKVQDRFNLFENIPT